MGREIGKEIKRFKEEREGGAVRDVRQRNNKRIIRAKYVPVNKNKSA